MTSNITRRQVARTAGWAAPAVALATTAPAASASMTPPSDCYLTDEQLNAGFCSAPSIQLLGARSFSTTSGGVFNATTANNFTLKATCNYKGLVTTYFHTPSSQLGSQVPKPTARLADGTTYTGNTTLGQVGSGIAQTGWDLTVSIQWQNSKRSNSPASRWIGAVITIPFNWHYTAPNGTPHHCTYALQYTMGTPYSTASASMVNPVIIAL